jgi:hypothetical protein
VNDRVWNNRDFTKLMAHVALNLLGEPTSQRHSGRELRYGSRGSLSIDLGEGVYFDHEAGEGGGGP